MSHRVQGPGRGGGSLAGQLGHARSLFGADWAASRRVLTDGRLAWHARAMQAGTLQARSLARSEDGWTLSHARRRTLRVANTSSRERRRLTTRLASGPCGEQHTAQARPHCGIDPFVGHGTQRSIELQTVRRRARRISLVLATRWFGGLEMAAASSRIHCRLLENSRKGDAIAWVGQHHALTESRGRNQTAMKRFRPGRAAGVGQAGGRTRLRRGSDTDSTRLGHASRADLVGPGSQAWWPIVDLTPASQSA
jgi:hypothetical protein